jgi:hypothetical protein
MFLKACIFAGLAYGAAACHAHQPVPEPVPPRVALHRPYYYGPIRDRGNKNRKQRTRQT